MKASRLFSLVAMAALAVGCTQEEFVPAGEKVAVDLSNRPSLGDVVLDMGAQTRMAIADGSSFSFDWANGDKIGASIIDSPKDDDQSVNGKDFTAEGGENFSSLSWTYAEYKAGVKKSLIADGPEYSAQEAGVDISEYYQTVEYVSSNYPYTYADGIFDTPANLVEGNYMFYAPYNPQLLLRERVKVVLPQVQYCTDEVMKTTSYKGESGKSVSSTALDQFYKGTMEGFKNAPVAVGYKFLAAPENGELIKPSVAMSNLFAYPMFTIVNDFNGFTYGSENESLEKEKATHTMTIDSIQIYDANASSSLFYTAPIKSEKIVEVLEKDKEWDNNRLTAGAETSDLFDDAVVREYAGHKENNLQNAKWNEVNNKLTYQKNHVTCVIGKELAYGDSYHFHAILPAANYEHKLSARVFVTIDEVRYVIAKAELNTGLNPDNTVDESTIADFTFVDAVNGNEPCELVRGEHYPKAEIYEDGSAAKAFAGTMLTLNLGGETAAFQLNTEAAAAGEYGFETNKEFIDYLKGFVQRGVKLTEVPALNNVDPKTDGSGWKTYPSGVDPKAGNFAFAEDTKCIIDAQLIKDLRLQTILGTAGEEVKLELTQTNLPIADDVKFTVKSGSGKKTYTFTTLDEEAVEYKIDMTDDVKQGDDGEELVSGINNIGDPAESVEALAVELKVKDGENNAVVYLQGASGYETTATLTDCTGISAIYVNENTILEVYTDCTALIIANGGIINIRNNGSLTNENNEFGADVTINNSSERTIEGTLEVGAEVVANYNASWPTEAIPAASRINTVYINTANPGTLAIEQAQMDIFANLTEGVDLTLGTNITEITSHNDVRLTNLKSLTSSTSNSEIEWVTSNNAGIRISGVEIDGDKTVIEKVAEASTGVTFANIHE